MTKREENSIIHKVFVTLERIKKGTIKQIAADCNMTTTQVTHAIDRLIEINKAHVNNWDHSETARCPVRVIKLGRGVNKTRGRKVNITERDTSQYDVKLKMAEHKRWAATFKPHPDEAAAWMMK
jgi:hypothetical protein